MDSAKPLVVSSSAAGIARAAEFLRAGGLVAFPTETVYGLGARADDPAAVARIFAAKGRPADHPLIVHLPDAWSMEGWARDIPPVAWEVAARFWPGPLTLILRRAPGVPMAVTGGQDTIGVRVPGHPVALALLGEVGCGVAAPSANRFGRVSPTTAAHVRDELEDALDCIVDGGPCAVGVESTILDLTGDIPAVLRPGAVTAGDLAAVLGERPGGGKGDAPRVPGSLASHYAPGIPLYLSDPAAFQETVARAAGGGGAVAALVRGAETPAVPGVRRYAMPEESAAYARALYGRLREAEKDGCSCLVVELPPDGEAWQAVRDRLTRASAGR